MVSFTERYVYILEKLVSNPAPPRSHFVFFLASGTVVWPFHNRVEQGHKRRWSSYLMHDCALVSEWDFTCRCDDLSLRQAVCRLMLEIIARQHAPRRCEGASPRGGLSGGGDDERRKLPGSARLPSLFGFSRNPAPVHRSSQTFGS